MYKEHNFQGAIILTESAEATKLDVSYISPAFIWMLPWGPDMHQSVAFSLWTRDSGILPQCLPTLMKKISLLQISSVFKIIRAHGLREVENVKSCTIVQPKILSTF